MHSSKFNCLSLLVAIAMFETYLLILCIFNEIDFMSKAYHQSVIEWGVDKIIL